MVAIADVSLGFADRINVLKVPTGFARESKNLFSYNGRLVKRPHLRRVNNVRMDNTVAIDVSGNEVRAIFELLKDDGSFRTLVKAGQKFYNSTIFGTWNALSGTYSTQRPDITSGFDRAYIADGTGNYFYSTASGIQSLVNSTRPTASPSLTEVGAAVGFGTGDFEYNYSLYSSTEGWESRPKATNLTITKADPDLGVRIANPSDAGITGIYDQYRIYRRLQGGYAWYLIATVAPASFPYTDTTTEVDLLDSQLSEIFDNETGLEDFAVPSASSVICFFKDRLFIADGDTVLWSKVGLPFLFRTSDKGRKQIGDDGDPIVRMLVYNESLVVFKSKSIWVLNGDALEDNFVFFPASRWVGSGYKFAEVPTPKGIFFFGGDRKMYRFDLSGESVKEPYKDVINFDTTGLKFGTSVYAGYYPAYRQYIFASYLTSTTCDAFAVNIDTGAMHPLEFLKKGILSMGTTYLHWGTVGRQELLIGDYNGFLYRFDDTYDYDGEYSAGTYQGRVGSATANTLTGLTMAGAAAAFYTTNDGLKGQCLTVVFADGTKESHLIASNTATVITISDTFTATPTHYIDKYYIGGIDVLIWFHRIRNGSQTMRFNSLLISMDTTTQEVRMGATIDNESTRTRYKTIAPGFDTTVKIDRRGFTISPFLETFGNDFTFDLADIDIDAVPVKGRV